jgi:hypothetical protein
MANKTFHNKPLLAGIFLASIVLAGCNNNKTNETEVSRDTSSLMHIDSSPLPMDSSIRDSALMNPPVNTAVDTAAANP